MKGQAIKLNKNYIVVESWMTQELGLSGNELLMYAIIYGFSQAKNQICSCGDEYFASWLNLELRSIIRIKNRLKARGLIERIDDITVSNGGAMQDNRRAGYRAIRPQIGDKMSCNLGDNMSPNPSEIGDNLSCNSGKKGDKMSRVIKKYVTNCPEIHDNLSSRATLDNTKYNLNNNTTQRARACARRAVDAVQIVTDGDKLTALPIDSDIAVKLWERAVASLEIDIHSLGFDVWIRPLKPLGFCDNTLVLQAPSDGARDEVNSRYLPLMRRCLSDIATAG